MSEEEKGIYLAVSTYLKGPALEAFYALVAQEAKAYIESEHGQAHIRKAVVAVLDEQIRRHFSWDFDKDPRADAFKKIVTDAMFKELFRVVPDAMPDGKEGTDDG